MAFNFSNYMDSVQEGPDRVNRRIKISDSELDSRCEYYEAGLDNFRVTDEHRDAMRLIFQDISNVFVTGGAGTGKTSFMKAMVIPELNYRNINFAVTATTGIAGSHLEGRTLHSWAGIRRGVAWPPTMPNPQDMTCEMRNSYYKKTYDDWMDDSSVRSQIREGILKRLAGIEVLIVDEISMAAGDGLLGYLDYLLKQVRATEEAFGGVQMLMVGDFAQIPPVEKRKDKSRPDWAFLSRCWSDADVVTAELTEIFRQEDREFADFLNCIRVGDPVSQEYVNQFVKTLTVDETRNYSFLVTTNAAADQLNEQALHHFEGRTYILDAQFHIETELLKPWEKPWKIRDKLLQGRLVKPSLLLRIGTPILFTMNNVDRGYYNGTRGFIREVNIDKRSESGDLLEDNIVIGIPDGEQERKITLHRFSYTRDEKEDPDEVVIVKDPESGEDREVTRYPVMKQFPIIPATAITIHKSQGMSIDRAILHITNTFAAGQVYVGLSRLRSPDGLVLTSPNFEVVVDPHVMDFYRNARYQKEKRINSKNTLE